MVNQRFFNENATPLDRVAMPLTKGSGCAEAKVVFCSSVPLAMGYVPDQEWDEVYAEDKGFPRGTIFPSLDFPFYGSKGGCR